jgi:arylamine N-acetyltransferase
MADSVIDVSAYFARIGYSGPAEPTLATLTDLVAAHIRRIPYENLDPLLGVPVADLGPAALADKLIGRRRGSYCYEHNNLMRSIRRYSEADADIPPAQPALTRRGLTAFCMI